MLVRFLGALAIVAITLLPMSGCTGGGTEPMDGGEDASNSYDPETSANTTNN